MTSKKELIKEIKRLRTLHLGAFNDGFMVAAFFDGHDFKPWLSHLAAMTDQARSDGYRRGREEGIEYAMNVNAIPSWEREMLR